MAYFSRAILGQIIRGLKSYHIVKIWSVLTSPKRAAVAEWVRHTSGNTRVMRSNPTSITVGGVAVSGGVQLDESGELAAENRLP